MKENLQRMTDAEKDKLLSDMAMLAALAESHGLANTAKYWRDRLAQTAACPAGAMVYAESRASKPVNPV